MLTWPWPITCLRNVTEGTWNSHFSALHKACSRVAVGAPGAHAVHVQRGTEKKDKYKMVQNVSENVIDQGLKNSWRVRQPKWHDEILKVAQVSIKCGLTMTFIPREVNVGPKGAIPSTLALGGGGHIFSLSFPLSPSFAL